MKKIIVSIAALIAVFSVAAYIMNRNGTVGIPPVALEDILSFEDCERAGYPVQESYPRGCRLPDGRLYAEEIMLPLEYHNASEDMIRLALPYAGAVVGKEFKVTGEARGYWYFEASFPIEVRSPLGDVMAGSYATARGEWMTTDFVPFESEWIDLPSAYTGPATLILYRHNASGLSEQDAWVSVPIVVEW